MTLSLSPERMLEEIYAHSAAARFAGTESGAAVLGSEQASMLRRLLDESLAGVVAALSPRVRYAQLLSAPLADIVELEVTAPDSVDGGMLRRLIESAVVATVLETVGLSGGTDVRGRSLAAFRLAVDISDIPPALSPAG